MTENQENFEAKTPDKEITIIDNRPDYDNLPAAPATAVGPMEIMMAAVDKGMGKDQLEVIERMFEFDLRVKAQQAKEASVKAMAAFKENPPEIIKSKKAGFDHKDGKGSTEYSYADLAIVASACNEGLSKHGLSASWKHSQENDSITVTCIITHELGHSESTSLTAKPDQSGKKNPIQALASTISYLEKYTLLAITGLAAKGMDDDGNSAGAQAEAITDDQKANINTLLSDLIKAKKIKDDSDLGKRLHRLYKVKTVDELTKQQAVNLLGKLTDMAK